MLIPTLPNSFAAENTVAKPIAILASRDKLTWSLMQEFSYENTHFVAEEL